MKLNPPFNYNVKLTQKPLLIGNFFNLPLINDLTSSFIINNIDFLEL